MKGEREMDMSRLTTAHKIGLGGAIVLLVASFMPWYSVGPFSINGWDAGFLGWFGIVLGIAAGVVLALKAFGTKDVKGGGFGAEQIALLLGAASFVVILLRLLTESSNSAFGLFLAIIASAAIAYGSFRAMQDVGGSVDDMKRRLGGSGEAPPPEGPPMTPPGP